MESFRDNHIAHLLRLKRYEKPPPGYFENFLQEFRLRRQRDELVREPLWSICIDRVRDFVFWHPIRPLAYYSASIVAAAVCVAVIFITPHQQPNTTQVAVQESPVPSAASNAERELNLAPSMFTPRLGMPADSSTWEQANVPVLPEHLPTESFRSDESVPFNLEWELLDDQ